MTPRLSVLLPLAAATWGAVSATGLIACEDGSSHCADPRDCLSPDGGAGSDAGSEDGPASECSRDLDCDDGKACNGNEACTLGACTAGTPKTCEDANPLHCAVVCVEREGDAGSDVLCEVKPLDADGDQHGDELCAQAASLGDDCDDANGEVHPAGAEVCNGVDDDCDGKADIDDGLPLGGTPTPIVTSPGAVLELDSTWSDAASSFGVVWIDERDGPMGEVYFARVDGGGNKVGGDVRVSNMLSTASKRPAIAPGPNGFGVVWVEDADIYVQRIDTAGNLAGPPRDDTATLYSPEQPDLVHDGSGAWIVTFVSSGTVPPHTLFKLRFPDADLPIDYPLTAIDSGHSIFWSDLRRVGSVVLNLWSQTLVVGQSKELTGVFMSAELQSLGTLRISNLGEPAWASTLAASSDLFFAAWINNDEPNGMRIAVVRPNAALVCDKHEFPGGAAATAVPIPVSAAFDGTDFVVLHGYGSDHSLTVASPSCELVRGPVSLEPLPTPPPHVQVTSVAAGGGRVLVAWIEIAPSGSPTTKLMAQAFSTAYCN